MPPAPLICVPAQCPESAPFVCCSHWGERARAVRGSVFNLLRVKSETRKSLMGQEMLGSGCQSTKCLEEDCLEEAPATLSLGAFTKGQ